MQEAPSEEFDIGEETIRYGNDFQNADISPRFSVSGDRPSARPLTDNIQRTRTIETQKHQQVKGKKAAKVEKTAMKGS